MTKSIASCRNVGTLYREEPDDEDTQLGGVIVSSLDIPAGGTIAILGPSGSGKSTLLSLLAGLKEPNVVSTSPGLSRLDLLPDSDWEVQLLSGQRPQPGALGFVFQESHLMKALPVGLNLEMARSLTTSSMSNDDFLTMMQAFGFSGNPGGSETLNNTLSHLRTKPVASLSGGQQQRIAVGRAVSSDPRLIFCDEPTSSLDSTTARMIMGYLSQWAHQTGGTVLWITHDEELAIEVADGLIYVKAGQVVCDDGRPFAMGDGMSMADRQSLLADLKMRATGLASLDQQKVTDRGLKMVMRSRQILTAAEPARPVGRHRPYNHVAILRFIWHFVIAELFARQTYSQRPRGWGARFLKFLWSGPYSFNRPTFAAVLLLGMITLYGALVAFHTLEAAYERSMAQPEVSHFMLETRGKGEDGSGSALARAALEELSKDLGRDFAAEIDVGGRAPKAFGRRQDLFASVSPLVDETCAEDQSQIRTSALLVFQWGEPLYAGLEITTADGPQRIDRFERKAMNTHAVVTPNFLQRVLGLAEDAPVPGAFCFGRYNPVRIEIAGVTRDIPGSEDLQFEFAMTDPAYLSALKKIGSVSLNEGIPPYQAAALYFDPSYAEALFCSFDRCAANEAAYREDRGGVYKLNRDTLDQIRKLVGVAEGGRSVLYGVMAVMLATVAIAIALSVKAFITSNERFLCIMRAVGYRLGHITVLFLLEFLLITLAAALVFLLLLAAGHVALAPLLAQMLLIEPAWLAPRSVSILGTLAAVYSLVTTCGLSIMFLWWWGIRYVGQKLQGL